MMITAVGYSTNRIVFTPFIKSSFMSTFISIFLILVVICGICYCCMIYCLSSRYDDGENQTIETSTLLDKHSHQERSFLANYAEKTMQYFDRNGGPIDVKHSSRHGRHGKRSSKLHSNVCVFCGYKNNKNAVYCFNCNGVVGKSDM